MKPEPNTERFAAAVRAMKRAGISEPHTLTKKLDVSDEVLREVGTDEPLERVTIWGFDSYETARVGAAAFREQGFVVEHDTRYQMSVFVVQLQPDSEA